MFRCYSCARFGPRNIRWPVLRMRLARNKPTDIDLDVVILDPKRESIHASRRRAANIGSIRLVHRAAAGVDEALEALIEANWAGARANVRMWIDRAERDWG